MRNYYSSLILAVTCLCSVMSCSEPSQLGLSLVEQDGLNFFYSDTFTLDMETVLGEPLITSGRSRYLLGTYQDPIFGEASSSLIASFNLENTNTELDDVIVESLVLTLAYDVSNHIGILDQPQTFNVVRIAEELTETDYKSNTSLMMGDIVGTITTTPNLAQRGDEEAKLEIPLSFAFASELAENDTIYGSQNKFDSYFKGLAIVPDASNSAIYRLNLAKSYSKLTLFYKNAALENKEFDFTISNPSFCTFQHDYSAVDLPVSNDSSVYIQGMQGVQVKLDLPQREMLKGVIINDAKIVLKAIAPSGDDLELYPQPEQLVAVIRNSNDELVFVEDISKVPGSATSIFQLFDGSKTTEADGTVSYTMDISYQMQDWVDGKTSEDFIYLQSAFKAERPSRLILGDSNNSSAKAQLFVTYTRTK